LKKDKVAGTADGQEFRQPLNNGKEDGLKETDFLSPLFFSLW
jgi:hypothetical protein